MSHEGPHIPERDHKQRSFALPCERCGQFSDHRIGPRGAPLPDSASCEGCGTPQPLSLAEHVDDAGRLDGCPRCGYHTLCIQKDVNAKLGVAVVAVTYAVILALRLDMRTTIIVLLALTLVDLVALRLAVKRLLICYRCKAQYRGFAPGPRCRPFDLSTWEAFDVPKQG
ncbi:MAG: hypothetical protein DRQ55_14235 [Planctomycetota bacterium]|nr:MAG: hypothetical protein DRQ55_14235 [Planctomycetota bacterium]